MDNWECLDETQGLAKTVEEQRKTIEWLERENESLRRLSSDQEAVLDSLRLAWKLYEAENKLVNKLTKELEELRKK